MIIFKDKITDDEMISDSYDLKEIDGIAYEADCAMIEEGVGDIGMSPRLNADLHGKASSSC